MIIVIYMICMIGIHFKSWSIILITQIAVQDSYSGTHSLARIPLILLYKGALSSGGFLAAPSRFLNQKPINNYRIKENFTVPKPVLPDYRNNDQTVFNNTVFDNSYKFQAFCFRLRLAYRFPGQKQRTYHLQLPHPPSLLSNTWPRSGFFTRSHGCHRSSTFQRQLGTVKPKQIRPPSPSMANGPQKRVYRGTLSNRRYRDFRLLCAGLFSRQIRKRTGYR